MRYRVKLLVNLFLVLLKEYDKKRKIVISASKLPQNRCAGRTSTVASTHIEHATNKWYFPVGVNSN